MDSFLGFIKLFDSVVYQWVPKRITLGTGAIFQRERSTPFCVKVARRKMSDAELDNSMRRKKAFLSRNSFVTGKYRCQETWI